jgi:peptidoglycan/xylan/chitin deacetylase (PgdA/CDA1 family)
MLTFFMLLLLVYLIYFLPDVVLDFFLKNKDVLYKNTDETITFTFDDAPSEHTNDILDCLKLFHVKAVFFILSDNIAGNEKTLDRIVNEGHTIGNHGTKDEIHVLMHPSLFENDLLESHDKLVPWSKEQKYFRPGFGFFNQSMLNTLRSYGYTLMLGNVFPYDATISSSAVNTWYLQQKIKQGSIVILHDRAWTVDTLYKILSFFSVK